MAAHKEPYLDPAVEYARKPKDEKDSSEPLSGSDIAGMVGFLVLWIVYAGLFIWAGHDFGWNMILAVLAGIVGGFIAALITYVSALAGFNIF